LGSYKPKKGTPLASCVVCQAEIDEKARFCGICGAEQPKSLVAKPTDDPLIGHVVDGKYRIDQVIGIGGMGCVYRAVQLSLDKTIVIKVLHDKYRDDEIIVQRFQREAKAASRLSHPNSIQIIDFGMDDQTLYMAMEYLEGVDLFTLFKEHHPLGEERIAHIMLQICMALGEAHGQNIVHRDLKPENIMILNRPGHKDFVKVLDFGIAKILDPEAKEETLTQVGMVCGTPEYMSPEQARGEALDSRSDIYALGVLLFQLCTGELPFKSDTAVGLATKHILENPPMPSQKAPELGISPAMERIIMCALAKEPGKRFVDVVAMGDAFRDLLESTEGAMATMPEMEAVQGDDNALRSGQRTMAAMAAPIDKTTNESALYSETEPPQQFMDMPGRTKSYGGHHFSKDDVDLNSIELAALQQKKKLPLIMGAVGLGLVGLLATGAFLMGGEAAPPQDAKAAAAALEPVETAEADVAAKNSKAPAANKQVEVKSASATKPAPEQAQTQKQVAAPSIKKTVAPTPKKVTSRPKKPTKSAQPKAGQRSKALAMTQKGNDLIAQGQTDKGLAQLKRAQRTDPSYAEVYRALAAAYKMTGSPKKACSAIKTYLNKKSLSAGRQSRYRKMFCK